MPPKQENPDSPEKEMVMLTSATLYLMSAFSANQCPRLAIMIKRHLQLLAAHPTADPLLRSTSIQLIGKYWAGATTSGGEVHSMDFVAGDHSYH